MDHLHADSIVEEALNISLSLKSYKTLEIEYG